jgi:DegT/DnrJ/EryC1/StrS aminotransferase family
LYFQAFTDPSFFCRISDRSYVNRNIKSPDPVPLEGQLEALEVMKSGRMYRYNTDPDEQSIVSLCEKEIVDYTGHKYCVGLNSCGSALMLLLKTTGLKHGGKVISNAFTFGAVPSAIEHAGGKVSQVYSIELSIFFNCHLILQGFGIRLYMWNRTSIMSWMLKT